MRTITITIIFCLVALTGCGGTGPVRMMSRDSGKIYMGKVVGDGFSTATMDITIDGERYTGLFVVATTNQTFGLVQQYGRGGPSFGIVTSEGGTRMLKGIFTSPSGRGLRCESTATGNGGAGICVDDNSRIYDITISRK